MEKTENKWYKRLGWTGVLLCALCCALPIIGAAIGVTSLTALSFYLEKIGILALGLAAFFFWYAWFTKRRKAKICATTCDTDCDCKSEIVTENK